VLHEEEIRQYLHWLQVERKTSWSNVNLGYNALKFLYVQVLKREWKVERLARTRGHKRLPEILSRAEIRHLIDAVSNVKQRLALMTTYSAGLRVNETAHLRVSDIDSQRMLIRVEQGKGKKDRYTLLSERLCTELRVYWRRYRPSYWLFPGMKPDRPYSPRSIQQVFDRAKKKPASPSTSLFTPSAIALPHIF
jgi:integrase